jgi:Heavy metal binding domain
MDQRANMAQVYFCPMHSDIRQPSPGKCTKCGMDLVPEGTRFALLRHMVGSPRHLAMMVALMAVAMVIAMMVMK